MNSAKEEGFPRRAAVWLKARPAAAALGLFALLVLLLDPLRNIPLDDDWMYMYSVGRLLKEGTLAIHDLASPVLVFHVLWGGLFAVIGGLNYTALRFSTLVLAASAVWLLAERGGGTRLRLNPGVWLLLNPVFLALSFTYMTDVPYLCWTLAAALLYARGIEEDSAPLLLAASCAASLAFLVRQLALALPLCAAAALFARQGRTGLRRLPYLLPAVLAAAGYYYWFYQVHGANWAHVYYSGKTLPRLLDLAAFVPATLERLAAAALYLGLFTAPYTLRLLARDATAVFREKGTLLCLAALLPFFWRNGALPYFRGGGVICDGSIGQTYIGDALSATANAAGPLGSPAFMGLLTAAALLSLLVWCSRRRDFLAAARADTFSRLLWGAGLLQVLVVLVCFDVFFDRYLLPLLPAALLTASRLPAGRAPAARVPAAAAAAFSALLALWAVAGTWDYLNLNEAKWAAGRAALLRGISPERIDNGYEWDAVYSADRNMAELKRRKKLTDIAPWDWTELTEVSALSSFHPAPVPALELASAEYFSPLTLSRRRIYINRIVLY